MRAVVLCLDAIKCVRDLRSSAAKPGFKGGGGGGGGGARMVGVAGGGVEGWGSASGPIRKAGGCYRLLARYGKWGGGGGGGGGGGYDRVSGSPGYSTVVQFMRAGINRQPAQAFSYYYKLRPEKL